MAVKSQKRPGAATPQAVQPSSRPDVAAFLERHCRVIAFALVILATVRIVATYTVFNIPLTEPAIMPGGREWLAEAEYGWEQRNRPASGLRVSLDPILPAGRRKADPRAAF